MRIPQGLLGVITEIQISNQLAAAKVPLPARGHGFLHQEPLRLLLHGVPLRPEGQQKPLVRGQGDRDARKPLSELRLNPRGFALLQADSRFRRVV